MTPESFHDAARDAPIDGRSAFTMALRKAMVQAAQSRQREICLVDPDFEVWPLDDAEFLAALAAWGRLPLRRMILVACNFNLVPRSYARFTEWRGNWAHVVEAHATDIEPVAGPHADAGRAREPAAGRPPALARARDVDGQGGRRLAGGG